ncbi:MAG TPA: glycosyltransferase, partial [Candidatus Acidoferrum sp.]|nr:glycosyltransferase [Candidatus Acidoferrum sp.]
LECLARVMGIRDHLRFVGAVSHEDVGEYYRAADLFLFPSTSETQGIVVLEALSVGLPVVAVSSDAAGDLLGDGQGGMLTSEHPEQFMRSVVKLWESPERREAMGDAGRHIAAQYAPDACAARLLGLYAEIMESFKAAPTGAVPEASEART